MIACDQQPEYAGLTFGMVSMLSGSRQHQRVDELLMRHLSPIAYENRKILCGIPPHFQGGERDVMFLSLVTSPRIDGTPLPRMGFGARDINKKRFNVAASRARDQMWVIHSLEPNYDLRGYNEDLRSRLILHARTASGLDSKLGSLQAKARSPFEIEVGERLLSAGYEVEPAWMVGKLEIDLVVLGEGNRKLAIECDGEASHPPSKLMEDLSRERILEITGGWRFQRIRGSAFFRDPEIAMKPIFERLEREGILPGSKDKTKPSEQEEAYRLLQIRIEGRAEELRQEWDRDDYRAPEQSPPEPDPSDSPAPAVKDIPSQDQSQFELPEQVATAPEDVDDFGGVLDRPDKNALEPYRQVDLTEFRRTAALPDATANLLVPMMVEIAKVEGPVHREILLKRVREKFAYGRLTGSTRDHVVRILSGAVSAGSILRMGDCYVVDLAQAANPPRNRGDRDIDHIFERELSSVMKSIRNDRPALTREQILREVANRFGYQRISEKVRSILDRLLDEQGF